MPNTDIAQIELLCLDVDGVMTDGSIMLDNHGNEIKRFNAPDGLGIKIWIELGYYVAIITGRSGMAVTHRAAELGIKYVYQGVKDKGKTLQELLNELGLKPEEAAVLADDLPDLPMMRVAGYAMAVGDGVSEVRSAAAFVTVRPGGHGAVRESIEHLLKAKGRWDEAIALFG